MPCSVCDLAITMAIWQTNDGRKGNVVKKQQQQNQEVITTEIVCIEETGVDVQYNGGTWMQL